MEQLNQILEKYNCPRRKEAARTSFEEIESITRFKLPEDYKAYIMNYAGFENSIGQEFVRLWDFDELIEMNQAHEIFDNLSKTLGIGTNGGGEFIALEHAGEENFRVVLSPFIDLDCQITLKLEIRFSTF